MRRADERVKLTPLSGRVFQRLLCLYAFPECHMDENGAAHRLPLCYEDW